MKHLWLVIVLAAFGGACLLVWSSAIAGGPAEPLPGVTIGDRPAPAVQSVRVADVRPDRTHDTTGHQSIPAPEPAIP